MESGSDGGQTAEMTSGTTAEPAKGYVKFHLGFLSFFCVFFFAFISSLVRPAIKDELLNVYDMLTLLLFKIIPLNDTHSIGL